MADNRIEIKMNDETALLTFLKLTKDGKFAEIDANSLSYGRVKEEREEVYGEEEYFYGVS